MHSPSSFLMNLLFWISFLVTKFDPLHSYQIGRPVLWSLAAEGEAGVRKVLQMLRDEFELTMALSGCCSLKEITRNHIVTEWDKHYPVARLWSAQLGKNIDDHPLLQSATRMGGLFLVNIGSVLSLGELIKNSMSLQVLGNSMLLYWWLMLL